MSLYPAECYASDREGEPMEPCDCCEECPECICHLPKDERDGTFEDIECSF